MNGIDAIYLNNGMTVRDSYPTAQGSTVSQVATGPSVGAAPGPTSQTAANIEAASLPGGVSPIIGGFVFVALVFGLMFLAKRLGTDDDFKSLRPSVYNVVTIATAAAAGLPLLKYGAVKLRIPGVSAWIMAA